MDNRNGHLLAKFGALGCPFHGLVEAGKLTLPNNEEIDYPQPGGGDYDYNPGDTLRIAVPGAPGANRTAEQQATDAANGWQWWDQAILGGQDRILHGQALGAGSWIYVDAAGTRWLVKGSAFGGWFNLQAAHQFDVQIHRFGEFGADAEEYTVSATLSDWQQSSPNLGSQYNWALLSVVDTTPSGDRAIVMISSYAEWPFGAVDHLHAQSLGYLLVEISGAGESTSMSITVLRSRSQTLGEYSEDALELNEAYYKACLENEVSVVQVGGYPSCTGSRTTTRTPTVGAWLADDPQDSESMNDCTSNAHGIVRTRTEAAYWRQAVQGKIMAMWFGPGGAPTECLLDIVIELNTDIPFPQIETSGARIERQNYDGQSGESCRIDSTDLLQADRLWTVTRNGHAETTATYRLRTPTHQVEFVARYEADERYELQTGDMGYEESRFIDDHWDMAGETAGGTTDVLAHSPLWSGVSYSPWSMTMQSAQHPEWGCEWQFLSTADFTYILSPVRWSSTLLGFLVHRDDFSHPQFTYVNAFHPGGGHIEQKVFTDPRYYGSYNPVTGAVEFARETPVCWV